MSGSPTGGTGGATPAGPDQAVQINSQGTALYGDSGCTYIANSAFGVSRNHLIAFNNDDGYGTHAVYQTSNGYLEFYINGSVRLQM